MTKQRLYWTLVIPAAAILAVTMGIRQSLGLFLSPLNTSTGLGIATVSFAMAIAQLTFGLAQPLFGMLADQVGSYKAIVFGTFLFALGLAITPYMSSGLGLVFAIGIFTAAGSFSILIGAVAQKLPPKQRSTATGFINAGGSLGQFIFAPITQALISSFNWVIAIFSLAVTSLTTIFLALPLREKKGTDEKSLVTQTYGMSFGEQLRIAFKDRSYLYLNAGFFTCGFHIAFLVTHLPGQVSLCGLPASVGATSLAIIGLANVVGSIGAGWLARANKAHENDSVLDVCFTCFCSSYLLNST
jgi:MFS family permease